MKKKIKKIVLINPKKPLQKQNQAIYDMFERNKSSLKPWLAPPLSLLTIASYTPPDIEVKIIDEHYEQIDYNTDADLVGLTAMTHQALRAYEIAKEFRKRDIPVVMGGVHASVLVEEALENVDSVFVGEAEGIWEDYLRDLDEGKPRKVYKRELIYDMRDTRIPCYEKVNYQAFNDLDRYFNHIPVQATRGCPHDCSFCVVSKFYGKKIRKKEISQVIKEIECIQSVAGDSLILFADDNLFVDKKYAKELLRELIPLKIKYVVQTDIKVAEDQELLQLAYKSGCQFTLVGFESITNESLSEINTNQWKMKQSANYSKYIKKIQDNGVAVFGAFIIGFTHDNFSTFDLIKEFVLRNNILCQFTLLTPLPGSRIYDQYKSEGKLFNAKYWDKCGFYNMVFKHDSLTPEEAEQALIKLYDDVYQPQNSLNRFLYLKNIYKSLPKRWE